MSGVPHKVGCKAGTLLIKSDASNYGMHPTPRHAASHVCSVGARVMPGVSLLR